MDPIVHESFESPLQYSNDFALLKLAEKVDLNIYTQPASPLLTLTSPERLAACMVSQRIVSHIMSQC